MFLSDVDIKKEIKRGTITIEPFDELRLQPASYDIVLGNTFIVNDAHTSSFIDPANKVFPKTREVKVADGQILADFGAKELAVWWKKNNFA